MNYLESTTSGSILSYLRNSHLHVDFDSPAVVTVGEQRVTVYPGPSTVTEVSDTLSITGNVSGLLTHIYYLDEDEDPTSEHFTLAEFLLMCRAVYLHLARERDA